MSTIKREQFAIIPDWVVFHPDLTDKGLRLYNVLARKTNSESGVAFPSRATLATWMQCSENTVDRARENLADIGALVTRHRQRADGSWSSNEYELVIVDPKKAAEVSPSVGTPSPHPRPEVSPPMGTGTSPPTVKQERDDLSNETYLTRESAPTPSFDFVPEPNALAGITIEPGVDLDLERATFVAHTAAKGRIPADPVAAWRLWIYRANQWAVKHPPAPGTPPTVDPARREHCAECDDNGWLFHDDSDAVFPCPSCSPIGVPS